MAQLHKIERLEELIKESIKGDLIEQQVERLVAPGENFGSVIYKVDFKVKNGDKEKTYHAVAKCTPPNPVTQEMFNIQVTTKAEIAWYTTVIPTIKEFQEENGVEQVADFFQKFYGARINLDPNSDIVDINAVILTENLKPLGYKNVDRHIGFDFKTSKAILRDLATFHAVPLAIKLKNKELFDKNIKPYLPNLFRKDDAEHKKNPLDNVITEFKKIPELLPYIDRIEANIKNHKHFQKEHITKEPWGSVCHNDFWINNIMVKEGENPDLTKSIILDFQVQSYGSIAIDVLFFLVTSVALEVIKEHFDKLQQHYWNEFIKNLNALHIDTLLFSHEEFLEEINKAGSFGQFGHAIFHTWVILNDKGHTDFDSSNKNFKKEDFEFKFSLNNRHIEKYKWLVNEFVKRGWI